MITGKTNNDVSKGKDRVRNGSSGRTPDEQDEKKVKI